MASLTALHGYKTVEPDYHECLEWPYLSIHEDFDLSVYVTELWCQRKSMWCLQHVKISTKLRKSYRYHTMGLSWDPFRIFYAI